MKLFINSFIGLFIIFSFSMADQRSFVWTYEYMIMEQGEAEIEQYTTYGVTDFDEFEGNTSTELNFEAEIGMNKHYDIAIYQNFKQASNGSLFYSGFKLRTRYKIGEKGDFIIDPLIYIEYKGVPDFHKHEIETKIIFEKDFGNFRIALNPYFEYEIEDDKSEFVPKYAFGMKYQLSKLLSLGLEGTGDKNANYIGPTIAHGSRKYWSALGFLYSYGNITEGKPEFQLRLILGLFL